MKPFEDALDELLLEYGDADPDEVISALELAIMKLKEQHDDD